MTELAKIYQLFHVKVTYISTYEDDVIQRDLGCLQLMVHV